MLGDDRRLNTNESLTALVIWRGVSEDGGFLLVSFFSKPRLVPFNHPVATADLWPMDTRQRVLPPDIECHAVTSEQKIQFRVRRLHDPVLHGGRLTTVSTARRVCFGTQEVLRFQVQPRLIEVGHTVILE